MYTRIIHGVLSKLNLQIKETTGAKLDRFILYSKDVYNDNTFLVDASVYSYNILKKDIIRRPTCSCAEHNTEVEIARNVLQCNSNEYIIKMYTLALLNTILNKINSRYNEKIVSNEIRQHISALVDSLWDVSWFDYRSKNTYPFSIKIDFTSWNNINTVEDCIIEELVKSLSANTLLLTKSTSSYSTDFLSAESEDNLANIAIDFTLV